MIEKYVQVLKEHARNNELYRQMNGMSLREMDKIIYPVCKPCGDHEKGGFVEGVKIGIKLLKELDI